MKEKCRQLAEKLGARIYYFDTLASTNDTARSPEYSHGDIIVAGEQTRGRGQRGNSWSGGTGQNLTFSLIMEPRFLPAHMQFLMSVAVSLALVDAVDEYGIEATVKWPNDIYVGEKKVAGILIENDLKGTLMSRSIIGIGLNVNQIDFDPSLPNPTSIKIVTGREADLTVLLGCFFQKMNERYRILKDGQMDRLMDDYHQYLFGYNTVRRYRLPSGREFEGRITGVDESGVLDVLDADTRTGKYLFKEIEYILESTK